MCSTAARMHMRTVSHSLTCRRQRHAAALMAITITSHGQRPMKRPRCWKDRSMVPLIALFTEAMQPDRCAASGAALSGMLPLAMDEGVSCPAR